jgi:hypothetical protein
MDEPAVDEPAQPNGQHARPVQRNRPVKRVSFVLDWLFRNRATGEITIAQFPNLALWIYLATAVLKRFASDGGSFRTTIDWCGVAALGWWALDELIRGVNPWRRLLGLGGTAFAVAGLTALL